MESVYSGNLDQARALLARLFDGASANRIVDDILSRLRPDKHKPASRYWKQIRLLNSL